MEINRGDLIIPVYLNQRIVFDLIAMLNGGISTITRVATTESNVDTDQRRYGAEFGLSKALSSLLKINVSGERDLKKEGGAELKLDQEKVHTPASLFQNLRQILLDENALRTVDENFKPQPHQLIEFTASLQRNPLIQTMDSFISIMEMAIVFNVDSQPSKGKKQNIDQNKIIKKQMENFLEKLKAGDTVDIVTNPLPCNYRAVITLETEYLNDPTMSDLVEGQFNALGKVIRVIDKDKDDSISLIRKTSLSMMPEHIFDNMISTFDQLSAQKGFKIPEMEWEIKGPVMQIIPVAIFA